jgi:hypothetical protein
LASRSLLSLACASATTLALALPAVAPAVAPAPPAPTTPATTFLPNRIVIAWDEDASNRDKIAAKRDAEVDSAVNLGSPDFQVVEPEAGQSTSDAISELRSDPAVASAERDSLASPASIPNDPFFLSNQLWALRNTGVGVAGFGEAKVGADIDATDAWDQTVGTPSTVVADIDSGYRFEGADLGPVVWTNSAEQAGTPGVDDDADGKVDDVHGYDFVGANAEAPSEDADPTDDNGISGGHGVHTAGTIGAAGNNGFGITGVAQNARIMPLRVCANAPKNNTLACPISSIIAAINFAGAHGARVANISLTSTSFSSATRDALAKNPKTLFVISAGNDTQDNEAKPHYPCNYEPASSPVSGAIDNVVCVAATNQADALASFSDWGATSVDLAAPGTEILSTYPVQDMLGEDAELTNFPSRWTAGSEGGFGRTNEPPQTSFGISDTPEEDTPVPNSTRESELTVPMVIPSGYGNCQLTGRRFVSLGSSGKFTQEILVVGGGTTVFEPVSTSGSTMVSFATPAISGLAGSEIKLRFRYAAGPTPAKGNGVWLDDLQFTCYQATNVAPGYAFLQGTSMAAPQVSGTAALMFSLAPLASVTTVRNALLSSVDPLPTLAGKTVSGGRLDAKKALDKLDTTPPGPPLLTGTNPASPNESGTPRIIGTSEAKSTVKIYAGGGCLGSPVNEGSASQLESPGIQVTVAHGAEAEFSAKAIDQALNASTCSAPTPYRQEDDLIAPLKPTLTTVPASPAASGSPRIFGSAEAGSTVAIYENASCLGTPVTTVAAAVLTSPGVPVTVPASTTLTYSATASDTAAKPNVSPCSAPVSYTNNSLIGAGPLAPIPPELVLPPSTPTCTVPKLAGKTLPQAKAALKGAGCTAGKVTKPKTKPGQRPVALVVKSSSPAAGGQPASGGVALKLGPKPRARHH